MNRALRSRVMAEMIHDGEASACDECGRFFDNADMHEIDDLFFCDECFIPEVALETIEEGE